MTSRKKIQAKALGVNIHEASSLIFFLYLGFYLCKHLFYVLYVHLSIGVRWYPRLHYDTLPIYLVYPIKERVTIEWLYLVIQDFDRS
jgi:hypothetical protein